MSELHRPRRRRLFSLRTWLLAALVLAAGAMLAWSSGRWAQTVALDGVIENGEVVFYRNGVLVSAKRPFSEFMRRWNDETGQVSTADVSADFSRRRFPSYPATPDGRRIRCDADGTAIVYDTKTNKDLAILKGAKLAQSILKRSHNMFSPDEFSCFTPDGARVVTVNDDGCARIWDTNSGAELAKLDAGSPIVVADVSPDGKRIVTTCADGHAYIWKQFRNAGWAALRGLPEFWAGAFCALLLLGSFLGDWRRPTTIPAPVEALTASPAPSAQPQRVRSRFRFTLRTLLLLSLLVGAVMWLRRDERAWILQTTLPSFPGARSPLKFFPGGARVVTERDEKVAVCDALSGAELAPLADCGSVKTASFSADGATVLTVGRDGTARVWDAATGKQNCVLQGDWFCDRAFLSPDGRRVVTTSRNDNNSHVSSALDGSEVSIIKHYTIDFLSWRPDSNRILAVGTDGSAREYNPENGEMTGSKAWVLSAVYSPDGALIATCNADKTIHLCEAQGFQPRTVLGYLSAPTRGIQFSPDGRYIAARPDQETVQIWDIVNGARMPAALTQSDVFLKDYDSCKFSPDGKRYVTVAGTREVRIWDVASSKRLDSLAQAHALNAEFLPDGRIMVKTGEDGVCIWQRRRPEQEWGLAWLPQFWVTAVLGLAFIWSIWRDRRTT